MGDENLYLTATNEVDSGQQDQALWAKAIALCEGDKSKAKYKYIALRVEAMSAEETPHSPVDYSPHNLTAESDKIKLESESNAENQGISALLDDPKAPKISCSHCYAFVPSDLPTCSSCGKPLQPLVTAKPQIASKSDSSDSKKQPCPRCWNHIPIDASKCPACGKNLKKLEKATTGDIILSIIIPGWGFLIGLIALIKTEFKRGFTMIGIASLVIAILVVLRA
jgi:rRNA maturation endonuclease Nob1